MTRTRALAFALFAIVASSRRDLRAATSAVATVTPASDSPSTVSYDCYGDEFYYGWGRARDVKKALACYRASNDWMMLAILQINGDGAPVDIAGARASLNRVESKDADFEALDRIIKKREANPTAKFRRVDFCKDVANTTPSVDICQAREEGKKIAKSDSRVDKLRVGLDASARSAFDRAQAAYKKVAHADGERVYQEYIDGSGREPGGAGPRSAGAAELCGDDQRSSSRDRPPGSWVAGALRTPTRSSTRSTTRTCPHT